MSYSTIVKLFEKIPGVFLATAWGKNNKEDNNITGEVVRVGGKGWFSVDCACFRFDRPLTSASVGEHWTVNRVTICRRTFLSRFVQNSIVKSNNSGSGSSKNKGQVRPEWQVVCVVWFYKKKRIQYNHNIIFEL